MGKALWNVAVSGKGRCRRQARGPSAEVGRVECEGEEKSRPVSEEAALP